MLIVYALVELIIAASHQAGWIDIHTQHTSLCSMNAIFICVIVLVKMCFHMLNLCWFKNKKIFECFRCFWKVLCFYKNWKISKNSVTLFWRLSRGSSKSHAIAMSSRVDFDDLVASEKVQSRVVHRNFHGSAHDSLAGRPLKENLVLYPIQNSQRKRHSWIYFIHDW